MNKITLTLAIILLSGCGGSESSNNSATQESESKKIIVSGQSNAAYCDWTYFEDLTGREVINISQGGRSIQNLIDDFSNNSIDISGLDMIFVHGETDSELETTGYKYVSKVHEYQNLTGVNNIYFSTVGYKNTTSQDWSFDTIRNAIEEEASNVDYWHIGYRDAKTFRDRGMLKDYIHFTEDGCKEMMFNISINLL